ncbi:nuclear transport factor 2 family protein [Elizabethkingia ursingii]|uniref:nuclear transport factor 2 family protein n=1 Tax=Elizabethkingia ursingii TaxID=1756150 RepID=UPI0020110A51|nr:nuclear transport factor 2 family protein [Elizabethkingia ursingii]MCL1666786.1 nuclear transport factor 2 family protein [Elizabethkingia ursingii]
MSRKEHIIRSYINAYNQFDIPGMVANLHDNIIFKNIQDGETNLMLQGKKEFRQQAELAKTYFTERQQNITSVKHSEDQTEIEIDYFAVLAADMPNGLKKGNQLKLTGKSIFRFSDDRIIELTDIS